eukprot:6198053-Pleurochrysis_carterae.AAC.1
MRDGGCDGARRSGAGEWRGWVSGRVSWGVGVVGATDPLVFGLSLGLLADATPGLDSEAGGGDAGAICIAPEGRRRFR